ncbi:MAG: YggS family pyridoxal phosphate-dependent enzyme [Flavobacteriales bacterium]|nr:YggS family pyridoxal phosphate-dependent enzyme [Flavobacteriales bacterium]
MNAGLADRYAQVKAMLPPQVTLVAVSKTRTVEEIRALYDLGHRAFGENYPQELRAKQPLLPADIEWHFIGHLQRSNAKHVVHIAHLIHGVDGEKLAEEVEKRAAAAGRVCDILLQVHIAQEETKHGLTPEEVLQAVATWPWAAWPHVRCRGLMGMATNTADQALVKQEFTRLNALFVQIRDSAAFPTDQFNVLSMGMSGDLDLAVAAGSNLVRVGTALFGDRG